MKTTYTAEALATGAGRDGRGEQLFAVGYAACRYSNATRGNMDVAVTVTRD